MVRPSALAVLRLITSSNLVGCSTGRSDGLGTPENFVHEVRRAATQIGEVGSVGHQPPAIHRLFQLIHCRQPIFGCEGNNSIDVTVMNVVRGHKQRGWGMPL